MKRFLLIIFFAGLLATPFVMQRFFREKGETSGDAVVNRHGVYYQEVAKASGVDFTHRSPALDKKLENIMPIVASMGAGVSVADFDRDGWNDLYFTNSGEGSANALFRNNGDGTFTDIAKEAGVAELNSKERGVSMGAVWGDYDNDGFEDLLVYKWGKTELFKNSGGRTFSKVEVAAFPAWANINTAVWFDFDRDGMLDIFLGGYFQEDLNLWDLQTTRIMPESFEYAKNGGRKYLYRNLGDGKFEEISKELGIDTNRWALAAQAADLNADGFAELFIANDYGISELFLNDGGKRFIDVSERSGVGFAPKSGMNASVGDVFNDGRLGIYVSNISEEGVLLQGNNLWIPRSGAAGSDLKFDNLANELGVENGGWSWGAQFGDLNNDGNVDLFLTNGFVSAERHANYWYDYSKITVGNNAIIADAANWAPIGSRSLAGFQAKRVWLNDGAGKFSEVAQIVGVKDTFDGRAVALADLWNRGVLDIIVATQNGPAFIYKATVDESNRWLSLTLECTASNRSCIGTRAAAYWQDRRQVQEISGGSGFAAQNQRRFHFGFGKAEVIEKIEIRWPTGKVEILEKPELNRTYRVRENQ